MSDPQWDRLLEKLSSIDHRLEAIQRDLATDRANLWKILALTIAGAFMLIGIKIAFP